MPAWIWIAVVSTSVAAMMARFAMGRPAIAQRDHGGRNPPTSTNTRDRHWGLISCGLAVAVAAWVLFMPSPFWGMISIFLIPVWAPRLNRGEISERLIWKLAAVLAATTIVFALIRILVLGS